MKLHNAILSGLLSIGLIFASCRSTKDNFRYHLYVNTQKYYEDSVAKIPKTFAQIWQDTLHLQNQLVRDYFAVNDEFVVEKRYIRWMDTIIGDTISVKRYYKPYKGVIVIIPKLDRVVYFDTTDIFKIDSVKTMDKAEPTANIYADMFPKGKYKDTTIGGKPYYFTRVDTNFDGQIAQQYLFRQSKPFFSVADVKNTKKSNFYSDIVGFSLVVPGFNARVDFWFTDFKPGVPPDELELCKKYYRLAREYLRNHP